MGNDLATEQPPQDWHDSYYSPLSYFTWALIQLINPLSESSFHYEETTRP